MAKNQHGSNSSGGCVKLYKATLSTNSRNSNSQHNSIPVNTTALNLPLPTPKSTITTHVSSVKPASPQLSTSAEVIPIEFDPQLLLTLQNHDENSAKHQGSFQKTDQLAKEPANVMVPEKKLKKQGSMTDRFSSYINRVKNRMRTASDIGGARILRTRTTSSTGASGKSVSSLNEVQEN